MNSKPLTARQTEILDWVTNAYLATESASQYGVSGFDIKEIAEGMGVSESTVRKHLRDEQGFMIDGLTNNAHHGTSVVPTRRHLALSLKKAREYIKGLRKEIEAIENAPCPKCAPKEARDADQFRKALDNNA